MKRARRIVLAFGIVSLFGDLIYEGARGIIPSYLKLLGMSSALVGIVLGLAEFIAYTLRIATGYLAERSRKHRSMIFLGYGAIALLPLLAFIYDRRLAVLIIFIERFGKAIRSPARDAIIAEATSGMRGKAFGIHEAMDQIGASLGPIFVAYIVALYGIRSAFKWLGILFLGIPIALLYAYRLHPTPGTPKPIGFSIRAAHLAVFFNAASVFLPLLLLYEITGSVELYLVPLVYFYINAIDAITSLIAGKLYDHGIPIYILGFLLAPLPAIIYYMKFSLFFDRFLRAATILGIILGLWESVYRARIADTAKAGLAAEFGAYYTSLGLGLAISGLAYGYLLAYPRLLMLYAIIMTLVAILALLKGLRK